MQRIFLSLFALFLAFALPMQDAEAKRLGGGKSYGMQRQAPTKRDQDAQNTPAQTPGNAATQPGKRSWLGPIAGLAAGLGLAALFSHLGLGEEMANFLMLALLAIAAIMLVRWFMNRNQPRTRPVQYAGASGNEQPLRFVPQTAMPGSVAGSVADSLGQPAAAFPPGFDAEAFTRQAKVNFLRLQAANDACNLDDIREFTTPEMYAELKLDIDERHGASQRTEVDRLDAEVLEAVEEGNRHIVSVRFHGMLREDAATGAPFDEIWHLTRPTKGGGWLVAGIQQNDSQAPGA